MESFIIKSVIGTSIRCAVEYKNMKVQEACDFIVFDENKDTKGDIGVIALDPQGNIGIAFNCERMHRGFKVQGKKKSVKIYE